MSKFSKLSRFACSCVQLYNLRFAIDWVPCNFTNFSFFCFYPFCLHWPKYAIWMHVSLVLICRHCPKMKLIFYRIPILLPFRFHSQNFPQQTNFDFRSLIDCSLSSTETRRRKTDCKWPSTTTTITTFAANQRDHQMLGQANNRITKSVYMCVAHCPVSLDNWFVVVTRVLTIETKSSWRWKSWTEII